MHGEPNKNEVFLSPEDIKEEMFTGVGRQLIEAEEKEEKWASDSGEDDPTPIEKMEEMLREKF